MSIVVSIIIYLCGTAPDNQLV